MGTRGGAVRTLARRQAGTVRVGIFEENEMFAIGLRASLTGVPDVAVVAEQAPENGFEAGEEIEVAVVSPKVASQHKFSCPLVVCGEVPKVLAPGNVVLAELPRRTLSPAQLLVSVQAAAAGLRVIPPKQPSTPRLDGRRLQVLELLATGADTREIAERLGYSDRTIKSVIHEIQLTLGTRNRVQAVAEGVRQGLIGQSAEP